MNNQKGQQGKRDRDYDRNSNSGSGGYNSGNSGTSSPYSQRQRCSPQSPISNHDRLSGYSHPPRTFSPGLDRGYGSGGSGDNSLVPRYQNQRLSDSPQRIRPAADHWRGDQSRNNSPSSSRDGRGSFRGVVTGGRGGRGGGGRHSSNTHMGHSQMLGTLIRNSQHCKDTEILGILQERIGGLTLDNVGDDENMPTMSEWRREGVAGVPLRNDSVVVRANHFKVGTRNMPHKLFHYQISIFKFKRGVDAQDWTEDDDLCLGKKLEKQTNILIMSELRACHPEFRAAEVGITYDGGAALYASKALPLPFDDNKTYYEEVQLHAATASQFAVTIKLVDVIMMPHGGANAGDTYSAKEIQALNTALFSFAMRGDSDNQPSSWIVSGTKLFRTDRDDTFAHQLSNKSLLARIGYNASFKSCVSGLTLVSDISVTCFLRGGSLVELMSIVGGYLHVEDMYRDALSAYAQRRPEGLGDNRRNKITSELKNAKVKLAHLAHTRKLRGFGPAASSAESSFLLPTGERVTVEEYFERTYPHCLRGGRLQYPHLPTVDVGTASHKQLIPVELLRVVEGQSRSRAVTGAITSEIIKVAAKTPDDRVKFLTSMEEGYLMHALSTDADVHHFGIGEIDSVPMRINATVLCPPKLMYGNQETFEPHLTGAWNLANKAVFQPAPKDSNGECRCAYILAYSNGTREVNLSIDQLSSATNREAEMLGFRLTNVFSSPFIVRDVTSHQLVDVYKECKREGVVIVFVVLMDDLCYNFVKYKADLMNLPTQCMRRKHIERMPRGYVTNILMKVNAKLGGVNVSLASRDPTTDGGTFQFPPCSLPWFYDESIMLVGVDITHPDKTNPSAPSVVAVVASMDRLFGQFATHITTCNAGCEPASELQDSFVELLTEFKKRNNEIPRRVIVFRDGVANNQFEALKAIELEALKDAIASVSNADDTVDIAMIVCQKRHHTRLFHDNHGHYENPCVGLVTDSRASVSVDSGAELASIASPDSVEFYLNSHVAVLGTSKPCKYTLVYDTIGITLSQLQLLTFWPTHTSCRCTRGVSYALPAYYAHWAARRGKALLLGGARPSELSALSSAWLVGDTGRTMYFV